MLAGRKRLVSDVAGRTWTRVVALLAVSGAVALGGLAIETYGRQQERPAVPVSTVFATDDAAVPDDTVLLEQLHKAIDLRRREDFDRMLDARDPGELVEHATLSEAALNRGTLSIDALFIVGDELFGYLLSLIHI